MALWGYGLAIQRLLSSTIFVGTTRVDTTINNAMEQNSKSTDEKVDDVQTLDLSSHLLIKYLTSNKIILDKRLS